MKVFLSGSKTAVKLPEQLKRTIDRYYDENAEFLIGDCFGADKLMQEYLCQKGYSCVTVYYSGTVLRWNAGNFPVKEIRVPDGVTGYARFRLKDLAMSRDCDCAIMLWDGKTRGTGQNILNMQRMGKPYTVFETEAGR